MDEEPEGPPSVVSSVESLVRFRGRVSGLDIVVEVTEHRHTSHLTLTRCVTAHDYYVTETGCKNTSRHSVSLFESLRIPVLSFIAVT